MDIRTEQLQALLKQQELQAKKPASKSEATGDFAAALQQEVALGGATDGTQKAPPPGVQASLASQILLADAENISAASASSMTNEQAYGHASETMDKLESYANILREPRQGNLRDAYATLEDVESYVQTLKQGAEPLLEQNSDLAGLVNELEVLATTERFKFNRGDYLT